MKNQQVISSTDEASQFDLDVFYKALRAEITRRALRGPKLERMGGDEDEEDVVWYGFDPESDEELDFGLGVAANGAAGLSIGPAMNELLLEASGKNEQQWAREFVDVAQMVLNGQLAVVLTERTSDHAWQAGEVVWTDDHGSQMTLMTIGNHEHSRDELRARVLRNQDAYPLVGLAETHLLYPPTVNGRLMTGRSIDLEHPVPLDKATFNQLEETDTVRIIGGDDGEPIWSVFYRRTEFWLVCATVGGPLAWIMLNYVNGDAWWLDIVRVGIGCVGLILITFVTTLLLARRQAQLDAGKTPLFEWFEKRMSWQYISGMMCAWIAWGIYTLPIWTTKAEPQRLLSTFQASAVWPWAGISVLLIAIAMVVLRPNTRRDKIARTITLASGIGLLWYANYFVMYGGEDTAELSEVAVLTVLIMPIIVLIWYIADCFRTVARSATRSR